MQTQFKFSDGLYNFWLIHWFNPTKGPTLIRCEELQTPLVRITCIQAERAIQYANCQSDVDRFLAPWQSLEACQIENEGHRERIRGWLAKFGEKNGYQGLVVTSRGEVGFSQFVENEQISLFDKKRLKKLSKSIDKKLK